MNGMFWYAGYASNLNPHRFERYITGGVLAENGRDHVGARDPSPPQDTRGIWMPGAVYFATESATWGGGRALYDHEATGHTATRIYLITTQQVCDVLSQEMQLPPDIDWLLPIKPGVSLKVGEGHYETIVCTRTFLGSPVVTFAAPWRMGDVPVLAPSPGYLAMIARGLGGLELFDDAYAVGRYLERRPGVRGAWPAEDIAGLLASHPER